MKRPGREDIRVFRDATGFRQWLEEHHGTERELWMGFYKKGVAKESIAYPEAVDEGLCFGWIDGITYRVDDELYTIRFTPRTKRSTWSVLNVRRVGELTAAGRMHPAGIAAFEARAVERGNLRAEEDR